MVKKRKTETWRREILENLILTIQDILVLPFFIALLPFVWRSRKVGQKINSFEDFLYSEKFRAEIIIQSFSFIGDLIHVALAGVVCCSLYPL